MRDVTQLESEFSNYLDKEEKILWIGQPKQGFFLKTNDYFILPFIVIWSSVMLVVLSSIEFEDMFRRAPAIFRYAWFVGLFGFLFYMIVDRYILDIYRRKTTVYLLTDKRTIVKSGLLSQDINSYDLFSLQSISYTEKRNGSGTITFGEAPSPMFTMYTFGSRKRKRLSDNYKETPAFQYILDVRAVYSMLMEAKNSLK